MDSHDCTALAEDTEGSLWIATGDGLLRYRDYSFTLFKTPDGKAWNELATLCVASDGSIWTSSATQIYRFHQGQWILRDRRHGLWNNHITGLDRGPEGAVLARSGSGVGRFASATSEFQHLVLPLGVDRGLWSAHLDGRGNIWALFSDLNGNPVDLSVYTPEGYVRWVELPIEPGSRITGFDTDPAGNLWLGAAREGLFILEGNQFVRRFGPKGVPDHILAVCEDREGNIWLGTRRDGLRCLQPHRILHLSTREGLPSDHVHTLCPSGKGGMWIGTGSGLAHFGEGKLASPAGAAPLSDMLIKALAEGKDGTLWIATHDALYTLTEGQLEEQAAPFHRLAIRAVHAGRSDTISVGTSSGLWLVRGSGTQSFATTNGLAANDVRAVFEDRSGALWIATRGAGLNRFDAGRLDHLTTRDGLASDFPTCFCEDANGVLWIGTDRGLSRYEAGSLTSITSRQGLLDDDIRQLVPDDRGDLWIGSPRGLSRVRLVELEAVASGRATMIHPVAYDRADGLPSTDLNGVEGQPACARAGDGRLWFGTFQGAAIADPARLKDNSVPPPLVIECVLANGQPIYGLSPDREGTTPLPTAQPGKTGEFHFRPGAARTLEFRYTANTFVAPHRVRFRYQLEPFEQGWSDASERRSAFYTNLRPGHYRFRLIGCNGHGVWNEAGASFAFYIAPHSYQTWWFWTALGLFVASASGGVLLWRRGWQRRIHQLELQMRLDEQRQGLTRDLHDGVGLTLTQILQLSGGARSRQSHPHGLEKTTERIAALAEEAMNSFSQFLWLNNPKYDTLDDLVAHLREYAARVVEAGGLEAELKFPEEVPERAVPGPIRHHLLAVLKEALHNIVKHAQARRVRIQLEVAAAQLVLTVEDDGQGFDARRKRLGHGLGNMQQRAREVNGTLDLESRLGEGTRIRLEVPC